jgi:hypothetical protein
MCRMMVHGLDPMTDIRLIHSKNSLQHAGLDRDETAAIGVNNISWILYNRSPDNQGQFKVLSRSCDLPYDMMMGAGHLLKADIDKVNKAINDHEDALIAGILAGLDDKGEPANDKYIDTRLLEVDDSDYDIVRAMYRTAGLPEFDIQE